MKQIYYKIERDKNGMPVSMGWSSAYQKSCEEREAEIAWREIEEENRRNLPMPGMVEWAKKHGLTTPQA